MVERRRLLLLREMYAAGEVDLDDFERHVETVLCGEQPLCQKTKLPLMADPALSVRAAVKVVK